MQMVQENIRSAARTFVLWNMVKVAIRDDDPQASVSQIVNELGTLGNLSRQESLVAAIAASGPIFELGGHRAVLDLCRAIGDVCRWYP